jgi:hypothetical protein
MKNLFLLLVFLPVFGFGQGEPFKGANTLVVKTDQADLFKKLGSQLIQDGYQIKESNSDFQTITTEFRDVRWVKYKMVIAVRDGGFQIQGRWINEAANAVFNETGTDYELEWKKSGMEHDAWQMIEAFASSFGTDHTYFKK